MKLFIILVVFAILGSVWSVIFLQTKVDITLEDDKQSSTNNITALFAPEVEIVLDNKIFEMTEFLSDPVIINKVRQANEAHKNILIDEILELDKRWKDIEGVDGFIEPFLNNEVAIKLREFQKENIGFSEIFITDMYGLNVGQTNKTTDYYQADEDWWVGAWNYGNGKSYHGQIEFDESSQTEAISLYIPIIDPMASKVIGIAKTVVNIIAIKIEL